MSSTIFRLLACLAATVVAVTRADQLPGDDGNASISLSFNSTLSERALVCTPPRNAVSPWYYKSKMVGPLTCTLKHDDHGQWAMLNAYRSGGWVDVHWIHTNDINDPRCLVDWIYYGKSGKDVIAHIKGRTTFHSDRKRWCPLAVYQSGGVEGKQWAYCDCTTTTRS